MHVAYSSRRVVILRRTTGEWAKDTAEAKESLKDCLRSEITSNALAKIRGKDRSGSGGTSASSDNFGFYRWLKSNLLRAVVFPPWRISRHLPGEMFTLRCRWKFARKPEKRTLEKIFFCARKIFKLMSKWKYLATIRPRVRETDPSAVVDYTYCSLLEISMIDAERTSYFSRAIGK